MYRPSVELKTIAPAELPPLIRAIEDLMREAERLAREAADEHLRAFAVQMREKFGADEIILDEPHLPKTLAFRALKFLIALEQLLKKLEKGAEDEDYRTSIFNFDEPMMPQLKKRLELETARHQLATKQELDKTRQKGFGVKKYVWRASSTACQICAPLDGLIFSWEDGTAPGDTHPNCQCWSEPLPDDGPDDPPIEPVYPLETLLALLVGAGAAWKIGREIVRRTEEPAPTQPPKPQEKPPERPPTGKEPPPGGRTNTKWELGKHKSESKWENQMAKRGWDDERITDTIKNGKEYPAPNKVHPENGATRYEKDGQFIVRDDKTGEILQVSGPGFEPM